MNDTINHTDQPILPFVSATSNLVQLNSKWQDQLKAERERIRRGLITGIYDNSEDTLNYDNRDPVVAVMDPNNYYSNTFDNDTSILPVLSVRTSFPTQETIADEYTLNKEQRAAFMIITSHLDGDKRYHKGKFISFLIIDKKIMHM